jgi:hypothetical protein
MHFFMRFASRTRIVWLAPLERGQIERGFKPIDLWTTKKQNPVARQQEV